MPTYEPLSRFLRDHGRLTRDQKKEFREAVELFKEGLESGQFHRSLAIHRIDSAPGVFALSWGQGNDHRATFSYGESVHPGEAHIIWRRVGTHSIYRQP